MQNRLEGLFRAAESLDSSVDACCDAHSARSRALHNIVLSLAEKQRQDGEFLQPQRTLALRAITSGE